MDSLGTDSPNASGDVGGSEARSRSVLGGYEAELRGGGTSLTFDLPNGQKWKKKIWPRAYCAKQLYRWNSVEEILSYLISFDQHRDWISTSTPNVPPSGSIFFFNKKETKTYRNDGHQWKTRRSNAKCIREDRMKLKVHGYKLLYACYTHSLSNENFHRRSYWLLQNPDLIMVHYLEHSGNSQETDSMQMTEEDKRALTPANLDFLTISDRNLCSLLNMASSMDNTVALMRQLAVILHQNILKFRTILEMVEASNAILPTFVKSQNSTTIACRPAPDHPPTAGKGGATSAGVVGGRDAATPHGSVAPVLRRPFVSTVAAQDVSTPSGLSLNPAILSQVLASNLLVFYQGEKSLNCIALNPSSSYNSTTAPSTKPSPPAPAPAPPPQDGASSDISTSPNPVVNHSDYDPDKFTQFANALIQMNAPGSEPSADATKTTTKSVAATPTCVSRCPPLLNGTKDKVPPGGPGWDKVPPGGPGWDKVPPAGPGWDKVPPGGPGWGKSTQADGATTATAGTSQQPSSSSLGSSSVRAGTSAMTTTMTMTAGMPELSSQLRSNGGGSGGSAAHHPLGLTAGDAGTGSVMYPLEVQSTWTPEEEEGPSQAQWPLQGSEVSQQHAALSGPAAVEMPDCGTNLPLTSLWSSQLLLQDFDPLHSWFKGTDTDESGVDSNICNHPGEVLDMELPLEVESLVSSSEFFQTSQLVNHDSSQELCSELMTSIGGSSDWEVDFSLLNGACSKGVSSQTSEELPNYPSQGVFSNFYTSNCSNPQQVYSTQSLLLNQDSEMDAEFDRDTSSPFPSSSSVESESSHSTLSHDTLFDTMDSPSVAELCEMLGESPNAQHFDFAHMTLTENEQQQLLSAARIIQNAFRKYRCRRQLMRAREKRAALVIECYYKRYKEMKKGRAVNRNTGQNA